MNSAREAKGRRVSVGDAHLLPGMPRNESFVVVDSEGVGDDSFLALQDGSGRTWKWFRSTDMLPARVIPTDPPRVVEKEKPIMTPEQKLIDLSNRLAAERGMSLRDATIEAGRLLAADTKAWHHLIRDEADPVAAPPPASSVRPGQVAIGRLVREKMQAGVSQADAIEETFVELTSRRATDETSVVNLHRLPGEKFAQMVTRIGRERNLPPRDAVRLCSEQFPALAASWSDGTAL